MVGDYPRGNINCHRFGEKNFMRIVPVTFATSVGCGREVGLSSAFGNIK
jgi:hypothetical protein